MRVGEVSALNMSLVLGGCESWANICALCVEAANQAGKAR